MMTLAFGTRPARAKAALTLCTRLARTMDGRSQDCVLLSSVHETSTFASEVIIWMLPHEPLVEKGIGRVQLGDARGQTAGLRKAAAFKGMNTHTGFRKGVALDRQTSTGISAPPSSGSHASSTGRSELRGRSGHPHHAELQHRREVVAGRPVLGELAVGHPEPVRLARREALAGDRPRAVQRPQIRALREHPRGHQVALFDDRLHCHVDIGELRGQPRDGRPCSGGAILHARLFGAERGQRVFDVHVCHQLFAAVEAPLVPELLEMPPHEVRIHA